MLESLSSQAVASKARSIYGLRLRQEDYDALLHKQSVSEIAAYLKNTRRFKDVLAGVNENKIHRGQLEQLIAHDVFERLARVSRYEAAGKSGLFDYVMMQIEIMEILRLALLLNAGSPEEFIVELPGYLVNRTGIDLISLARARTFADLLETVERTPYHRIIKPFIEAAAGGQVDYSMLEHALYDYYFKSVLKKIDSTLSGDAKKELKRAVCIEIELKNIIAIYRLKIFFKQTPEQIRPELYPYFYSLSSQKLSELVECSGADEFAEILKTLSLGKKFGGYEFKFIEDYTNRINFQVNKKSIRFSSAPDVVFYAFIMLVKIEQNNLTNIIEGVRYQMPPDQIRKLLIL